MIEKFDFPKKKNIVLGEKEMINNIKNNLEQTKDVDDYLEFVRYFGDNKYLYKKLSPLKEQGELSWKEIKNMRVGDINLEDKTITVRTNNKVQEER